MALPVWGTKGKCPGISLALFLKDFCPSNFCNHKAIKYD